MKLKKRWSNITGTPVATMKIAENYQAAILDSDGLIELADMQKWKIRECDRKDWRDWMPCRVRTHDNYQIRIYYVNINPESMVHRHSLILTVKIGIRAQIDEWENSMLISSHPAQIDQTKDSPPDEDLIQMAGQIASMGITRGEPFTIDGRAVMSVNRK